MYFALLRECLKDGDENHECRTIRSRREIPTRVLEIGSVEQEMMWLRVSDSIEPDDYVAFSHCWGDLTPEKRREFSTTPENFKERTNGFNIISLPQQFQDAVTVTRELGKKYLWIDSLCIIQEDVQDWEREVEEMDTVFAGAYCTIAANASENPEQGFLGRNSGEKLSKQTSEKVSLPSHTKYTPVEDTSGRWLYICLDLDDFDEDVRKSILSTRAWTLQESILSQRTLHFCREQTYFECGNGVRCGNLTKLTP